MEASVTLETQGLELQLQGVVSNCDREVYDVND